MNPELAKELASLGIVTAGAKWRRLEDATEGKMCWAGMVCWCAGHPRQVSMVPVEFYGRRVLITQCPECRGEITWCFWLQGEWTGTREIRVTEIVEAGPCARPHQA